MTRTKGAVQHVASPDWSRLPPLDHPKWPVLLRKWRISHYPTLTLRQLAAALGVSDGRTVRRWEAGEQGIGPGPAKRYEELRANLTAATSAPSDTDLLRGETIR